MVAPTCAAVIQVAGFAFLALHNDLLGGLRLRCQLRRQGGLGRRWPGAPASHFGPTCFSSLMLSSGGTPATLGPSDSEGRAHSWPQDARPAGTVARQPSHRASRKPRHQTCATQCCVIAILLASSHADILCAGQREGNCSGPLCSRHHKRRSLSFNSAELFRC